VSEAWSEEPRALVLVDFSAIAYACWATAERAEQAGKERWTEHLSICEKCGNDEHCPSPPPKQYDPHEVLKSNLKMKLATICDDTPASSPHELVMVLDSHPKWKYDTFPGYKANREERFNPRPEAEAFLREAYPGMKWVKAPGEEADDAIATIVFKNEADIPIVIASGDKDLWALYDPPHVRIYNPITQKYLEPETVLEKFNGLEPHHIRAFKAFWGDPSDGLPNVAPRQQKQLVPLIHRAGGDLLKVIELAKSEANAKCNSLIETNLEQVVINWKMAGLKHDVELEWK
jgi:5'-3' exonuclease